MLPRGLLREPLASLRRAGVFVVTKTNLHPDIGKLRAQLVRLNPDALVFESAHVPRDIYFLGNPEQSFACSLLSNAHVALVSGIGDPQSFAGIVGALGAHVMYEFVFADHHQFGLADIAGIARVLKEKNIDTVLTTEKDAVRLANLAQGVLPGRWMVLRIKLKVTTREEEFCSRLRSVCSV